MLVALAAGAVAAIATSISDFDVAQGVTYLLLALGVAGGYQIFTARTMNGFGPDDDERFKR